MKKNDKKCRGKMTTIGGQALLEGIMMRGPSKTAVSVRVPSGVIETEYMEEYRIKDKIKFLGFPVIRGIVNYIESMKLGYKALMLSADKAGIEEELSKEEVSEDSSEILTEEPVLDIIDEEISDVVIVEEEIKTEEKPEKKKGSILFGIIMVISTVLGFAIAIVLFMALPTFIYNFLNKLVSSTASPDVLHSWKAVIEGIIKMGIFILYLSLVTLMRDIKRVFQYHGAEHKAIFCYEAGEELTVENIQKYKRFHPRCGTSFLIIMLIVAIVFEGALLVVFPALSTYNALWVALKIALIFPICGCGYELIRICGRFNNLFTKIVSSPGLWVQRLTTKEPEDDMVSVAIEALKAVIPEDSNEDNW